MLEDDVSRPAMIPIIETDRLKLRARTPTDADALFVAMSDRNLMRYWSRRPYETVEELRSDIIEHDAGPWRTWAITLRGSNEALGSVSAGEKRQRGVSEIGYLLAHRFQGRGYAREAVSGLVYQLFAEGQRRVFADVDPDNSASIALLERVGFSHEGRLRAEWHTHIGVRDSLIYGLLAGDQRHP